MVEFKVFKVYHLYMEDTQVSIKIADEVFIATALLHREFPDRPDFTQTEIIRRVERENLFGELRRGVAAQVNSHCVANKAPTNSSHYRMLYATPNGNRRLLLAADDRDPNRVGKMFPDAEDVPPRYHELILWAKRRYGGSKNLTGPRWLDSVFQIFGSGRGVWQGEDPDEYVRGLRKDWE
jgi:hypothetical protein